MEHRRNHRLRQRIWLGLMTFVLVLAASFVIGQRLYAQRLVEGSTPIARGIQETLQPGQTAHYQVEVQVRRDPGLQEPPAPYHMPRWAARMA